jgi:hypothetical protein
LCPASLSARLARRARPAPASALPTTRSPRGVTAPPAASMRERSAASVARWSRASGRAAAPRQRAARESPQCDVERRLWRAGGHEEERGAGGRAAGAAAPLREDLGVEHREGGHERGAHSRLGARRRMRNGRIGGEERVQLGARALGGGRAAVALEDGGKGAARRGRAAGRRRERGAVLAARARDAARRCGRGDFGQGWSCRLGRHGRLWERGEGGTPKDRHVAREEVHVASQPARASRYRLRLSSSC